MGLFSRKKEVSPEELAFQEENRERLNSFQVTKAWGVKKYGPATQFIYDENARQFVVVEGPEDTFRERNPYLIDFDQAKDVTLEVEERWSEGSGEFETPGIGNILQEDYEKVYWRYNFFLTIKTDHPYAGEIRYQMNFKPTVTKVPKRGIIYRRGFEIGGKYNKEEIGALVEKLENLLESEAAKIKFGNAVDIVTLKNKDQTILEGLSEMAQEDKYLKKISNMTDHVKRANRIYKLLLK